MEQRQEKQKYLRDHIDMDQYEDFAQYCQTEAGEIDIDQWTFQYVKNLVTKYKTSKAKQQQQHQHQRSFANYQTADMQQAYSIVTAIQNSNHQVQPKHGQKSATDLLDSVFQASSNNSQNSSHIVSPPQIKNISPENKGSPESKYRSSFNISAFQNGNIWATTSNIQSSRKSAQFDNFWQFPTANNNNNKNTFKTESPFGNNNSSQGVTFNLQPVQYNQQPQKAPTFDELTKNISMQKKQGPYIQQTQKPSNMKKNQLSSNMNTMKTTSIIQSKQTKQQVTFQTAQKSSQLGTNNHQIKLVSQKPLKQPTIKAGNVASAYKMNKIPYQGPTIHKASFTDTIKCYEAMPRPQLNDKDLTVVIEKHQIVQRNFFVSDYVMYFLTVKPIGIVCKRNYDDFTRLRAALEKVYPGCQLPYLEKNSFFETNLENIKKQKTMLEFFLRDLIQNPQIRNSRIFEDFLLLKEHKAIKRKFEQYAKMDKLKGLQQLCVIGGKVDVVVSQNQRIYHEQLGGFLNSIQDILARKNKLIDTLGQQFNAVNQTLISLSKLSTSVCEQVKKFNQRVNDDEIPSLESTFNIISKSYEQWASRISFQSKVVTKRLAPFYKYQKDNINSMRQILTNNNSLFKSYVKLSNTQSATQSYTSDRLSGFKNGILQQSKNLTVLKYQLGYVGNKLCKQSSRFFQQMADSFKQKWIYKSQKYHERLTKDLQFYRSISVMTI